MFLLKTNSLRVEDKLADTGNNPNRASEASQFTACSCKLGWLCRAALLPQSRWVPVWRPRDCSYVCVSTKKSVGHGTDCAGATPNQPSGACSGTVELPFTSIFLIANQGGVTGRPALVSPRSKHSRPFSEAYKPPG